MVYRFISVILITSAAFLSWGCSDDSSSSQGTEWQSVASTEFGRQARWSPDGNRVLFGDDRAGQPGLFVWALNGEPARLSDLPHNWDYRWSPDGEQVCFSAPGEPGDSLVGIWTVEVASGERNRLTEQGRDVCWKSDGNALFARFDRPAGADPGVYEIDVQSGNATLVKAGVYKPLCSPRENWLALIDGEIRGNLVLITPEGVENEYAEPGAVQYNWSADGRSLCLIVNDYTSGTILGNLWRFRIDGNNVSGDTLAQWAAYPTPSPDGNQVAFLRMSNGQWRGLWLVERQNREMRIATYGLSPEFSPMGDRIAVHSQAGGIRILEQG